MRLERLSPGDAARLQRVLERAPAYAERSRGRVPEPGDAEAELADLPPEMSSDAKYTFALVDDGEDVGCLDLLRGYPDATTVYVGLLLVDEARHGRGLGRSAFECLLTQCTAWPEVATLRLAVLETNPGAMGFWRAMGFEATGETRPYAHTRAQLFERSL